MWMLASFRNNFIQDLYVCPPIIQYVPIPDFLNLGTSSIFDWIILCLGRLCFVLCEAQQHLWPPYPLDARSTVPHSATLSDVSTSCQMAFHWQNHSQLQKHSIR